ncbi:pilus assembly protein HicB [Segatella copri]|uniref:pilus assembly protein HicB n=1 Tax=Segatella copri TaxID=165179 RepID=UPI00294ACDE4|nr:pilus assembly protein HicB [Segatella copri]
MATKVTIQVEKGKQEKNFSCFMVEKLPNFGLTGYGNTAKQAIEDMYVAQKEIKELLEQEGKQMPELEFTFRFDIGSFFDYYSYLNMSGVAKKAGINASLMRQYSMGIHEPSKKRKQQILECLHQIAKELQTAVI